MIFCWSKDRTPVAFGAISERTQFTFLPFNNSLTLSWLLVCVKSEWLRRLAPWKSINIMICMYRSFEMWLDVTSMGWMNSRSRPITNPFGLFFNCPSAFVSETAIWVHEPGAAPQSMTVWPGCKIFVRSLISSSLNALRHLQDESFFNMLSYVKSRYLNGKIFKKHWIVTYNSSFLPSPQMDRSSAVIATDGNYDFWLYLALFLNVHSSSEMSESMDSESFSCNSLFS